VYSKTWCRCDVVVNVFLETGRIFIVLLIRLGLVWFSMVSSVSRVRVRVSVRIRIRVRFNFSDRVGI